MGETWYPPYCQVGRYDIVLVRTASGKSENTHFVPISGHLTFCLTSLDSTKGVNRFANYNMAKLLNQNRRSAVREYFSLWNSYEELSFRIFSVQSIVTISVVLSSSAKTWLLNSHLSKIMIIAFSWQKSDQRLFSLSLSSNGTKTGPGNFNHFFREKFRSFKCPSVTVVCLWLL